MFNKLEELQQLSEKFLLLDDFLFFQYQEYMITEKDIKENPKKIRAIFNFLIEQLSINSEAVAKLSESLFEEYFNTCKSEKVGGVL